VGSAEATSDLTIAEALLPRGPYAISPGAVAADQRRRLLAALPRVVARHGLEETTVAQIVKAAKVRRNSFYEQFTDKKDCFAAAYELAQERLLGVVTFRCYTRGDLTERVEAAVGAALELLASEPAMARLIAVEAPGAGGEIAVRHHEWLDRYGRMLRLAAVGVEDAHLPSRSIEPAIIGGIAMQVARQVLRGKTIRLGDLAPDLSAHLLSFYALPEPSLVAGESISVVERDGLPQPQSSSAAPAPAPAPVPA
jgi:AcrR family transcriptional regulator